MSFEQFQSAHENISHTGTRLLQYLQEIRAGRRTEGDDTKNLQSIEDDITKALKALEEQRFQVAVIAAMKAGKSTFLNVLIGADILASESEACTVCRTDIRPISNHLTPRLLEYREGEKKPVVIAEGESEEIRHKFLRRTHEIRKSLNSDKTTRFEIEHPIEAVNQLSALAGFTLVDTPGPNEWESADFSTLELKRTALEALRTCNAILFILDYSSFKDNTNSELLQELIEKRKETLQENTGKLYFILNKVDRKTEKDRPINDVIEYLKQALIDFGIPEPMVCPASAWQGLLAKLIQNKTATKEHKEDFKRFFIAQYMEEDENGEYYVPKMADAAPKALADSNIPLIEKSVIQTVIQNAGWNLLSDVLRKLDKSAKAIEDTLNTQISGWEIELEELKQKVEEYKRRAEKAKEKVQSVKDSVAEQQEILIEGFSRGVLQFSESAKSKIEEEIMKISNLYSYEKKKLKGRSTREQNQDIPYKEINVKFKIPNWIPFLGGISFSFETKTPLLEAIKNTIPDLFDEARTQQYKSLDPNKVRVKDKEEGEKLIQTINNFCLPHIQDWWIVTQDKLINDGNKIREKLVGQIQEDIQVISNELSDYLGKALQVELNINAIQFPEFEFPGIDAKITEQQETIKIKKKNPKYTGKEQGWCEDDKDYNSRKLEYTWEENKYSVYEINLSQVCDEIKSQMNERALLTQKFIQRIIERQIKEDFRNAEQQISDYIKRFEDMFDNLLKERTIKEGEKEKIRVVLETQKNQLNIYLQELASGRLSLDNWKPSKESKQKTRMKIIEKES